MTRMGRLVPILTGLQLQCRLCHVATEALRINTGNVPTERGQRIQRLHPVLLESEPVVGPELRHVDQRVSFPPLGGAGSRKAQNLQ